MIYTASFWVAVFGATAVLGCLFTMCDTMTARKEAAEVEKF